MRFSPLLLFLLLFAACSSSRYINPTEYPDARINFGHGGGFSGMVTEYVLLDNGDLLKKLTQVDSFEIVTTIDKDQTTQLFENYKFLNIESVDCNEPGNMYRYIHFHHEDTDHKIMWSSGQYPDRYPTLKIFHQNLNSFIPTTSK